MSTQTDTSTAQADASPAPGPAPSQRKQLSDFEKGKIIFAHEQGWGYQRIGDHIGRSKTTVQSFIKRYTERGTRENGKHTGRRKKISEDAEKAVLDLIEGDCSISKMALMQIPELNNVHPRTVDRMLREKGIRKKTTKAST